MIVRKVDVLVALFSYAGNGGVSAILPEIALWLVKTCQAIKEDERIGEVVIRRYGDIPLTMERNRVVKEAKDGGFDVILMIDSDNQPDGYLGRRSWAKPFWESSFAFAFERLMRGIPSVVCAPYCGPPPHPVNGGEENVYVFYATDDRSEESVPGHRIEAYSRQHAAQMRGIQEIGAGPTGVILYTTSAFDLLPIDSTPTAEILAAVASGKMPIDVADRKLKMQSWFWYEFTDQYQTHKASTEDVTNTREIQMAGLLKHKEPIVFCNWDAWALHAKPKYVGMPEIVRMEAVSSVYQEAVLNNVGASDEIREVDFTVGLTPDAKPAVAPELTDQEWWDYETITDQIAPPVAATETVPIRARMVAGRKVMSVGHETDMVELDALTKLASIIARTRGDVPLKMLEIGSWVGESAIALLGGAPGDSTIYCVDHWKGTPSDRTGKIAKEVDVWEYFERNIGEMMGHSVRPLIGRSDEVALGFVDPQELDLLFIDGDHTREVVLTDLQLWYRHVAAHGVLCGHDYCESFPGVVQAVNEWLSRYGLKASVLPRTSIWFVSKSSVEQAAAIQRASAPSSITETVRHDERPSV